MDSPFDVLGVSLDADDAALVEAYRRRVKETHPDQGGSAREFQRVQAAYERIRNGYEPDDGAGADAGRSSARRSGRGADGTDATDGDADAGHEPTGTTVEYLDYEALADRGWELSDEDLFEKARSADLGPSDHGELVVGPHETLLEAAESCGLVWPFACRGGACSNCAVAVLDGEMPPPTSHVLPQSLLDRGIRLSCATAPVGEDAKVVFNVKYLPGVDDLLLPASRFEKARSD